jgi:glycerol-3-phosphate acyltransferase PlsY
MEFFLVVFAYLLGSVTSGYVLGKLAGVDVRKTGSGNVGATNVARVVGKRQGILTLLFDMAKGLLPVMIAQRLDLGITVIALTGVAAFLGHLYPLYLKFKGGKGVATALGVLLALAPLAGAVLLLIFAIVAGCSRIISLASIVAAAAAPVTLWTLSYAPPVVGTGAFFGAMIVCRHRSNIRRLLAGTEPRLGFR